MDRNFCEDVKAILGDLRTIRDEQNASESILGSMEIDNKNLWRDVAVLRAQHQKQRRVVDRLIHFLLPLAQSRQSTNDNTGANCNGTGNNLGHGKKRKHRLIMNALEQANQLMMNVNGDLASSSTSSSSSSGGSRTSDSTPNDSDQSEDLLQQQNQPQSIDREQGDEQEQSRQDDRLLTDGHQQQQAQLELIQDEQPSSHYQHLVNQHMCQQHMQNVQHHQQQQHANQHQNHLSLTNDYHQHNQNNAHMRQQHHDLINHNGGIQYHQLTCQNEQQSHLSTQSNQVYSSEMTNMGNVSHLSASSSSLCNQIDNSNNTFNLEHMIIDTNHSTTATQHRMTNGHDHNLSYFSSSQNQSNTKPGLHGNAGGGSLPDCLDRSIRDTNYGLQHATSAPLPIISSTTSSAHTPASPATNKLSLRSATTVNATTTSSTVASTPTTSCTCYMHEDYSFNFE